MTTYVQAGSDQQWHTSGAASLTAPAMVSTDHGVFVLDGRSPVEQLAAKYASK